MEILLQNSEPEVGKAYDAYLRFNRDKELRELEDARQQYLHDYNSSIEDAREKGEAKGQAKVIVNILKIRFGKVSQTVQDVITRTADDTTLEQLGLLAVRCKSLAEFSESMKREHFR